MQASTELKKSVGEIIGRVTCQKRSARLRAVDRGRFVQLLRNALQSGQEDDHHVAADGGPQRDGHQRGQGPVRVTEPARPLEAGPGEVHPDLPDDLVEQAVLGIEEPQPDIGRRHDRVRCGMKKTVRKKVVACSF